ncbi:ribosomal protein L11 methyltransferase [Thermodesulfatator indicus DSM 15286]|uniref:Ribosomal protein L11 methyltransferase n=1 Tax=Thermodesulfatator indicus (strain DSM 15286 / JCM 11887 / CIR29812) TaxID=667014 RepID=F8AB77_THEID|nr:50S ribosomal protein L11 methyltransferase [Thermodesulfatator indicus]AEH45533.1 ribosomal protein L11 methyltransferase [Thermodesulfatator indicus DSM 15286]
MSSPKERIWLEISVVVPSELSDAVANFFVETTGHGVKCEDIEPHPEGTLLVKITGYLAPEQAETGLIKKIYAYLASLEELYPEYRFKLEHRPLPEEEWETAWQVYFKPIKVGKRLIIKPSWEVYIPEPKEIVIEIDPGRAFGTGHHPSTYLILETLEELFEKELASPTVLDVGTGTGILAIAAAKLGAKEVIAIDIDPEATEVARENILRNHLHDKVFVSTTPIWEIFSGFDLICANISAYELELMAEKLTELLNTKGFLLLSGFLKEEAHKLKEKYLSSGLKLYQEKTDREFQEWTMLAFQKD